MSLNENIVNVNEGALEEFQSENFIVKLSLGSREPWGPLKAKHENVSMYKSGNGFKIFYSPPFQVPSGHFESLLLLSGYNQY